MAQFRMPPQGCRNKANIRPNSSQADPVLQTNLAFAHHWVGLIKRGTSLATIAKAEGLSESFIRKRLTLAFLAPHIQRAILDGTLPPNWTTVAILCKIIPPIGRGKSRSSISDRLRPKAPNQNRTMVWRPRDRYRHFRNKVPLRSSLESVMVSNLPKKRHKITLRDAQSNLRVWVAEEVGLRANLLCLVYVSK